MKIKIKNQYSLFLQALGPNIRNLLKQCPMARFSTPTCFKLIIQLIQRLRDLHKLKFVHNDVKLENILVGHNDTDVLYLIDFGLATVFQLEDGKHVEKQQLFKFSGNFLFASLSSCRGYNKSRRDDIEAAFYILIYLINGCKLPWSDFEQKFKG